MQGEASSTLRTAQFEENPSALGFCASTSPLGCDPQQFPQLTFSSLGRVPRAKSSVLEFGASAPSESLKTTGGSTILPIMEPLGGDSQSPAEHGVSADNSNRRDDYRAGDHSNSASARIPAAAILRAQEITHSAHQANLQAKIVDIVRDPADVPPTVGNRQAAVVHLTLTAEEVMGTLDPSAGTTYRYWTFNGKVPGPMIRVREGDTVEVTLGNAADSQPTWMNSCARSTPRWRTPPHSPTFTRQACRTTSIAASSKPV